MQESPGSKPFSVILQESTRPLAHHIFVRMMAHKKVPLFSWIILRLFQQDGVLILYTGMKMQQLIGPVAPTHLRHYHDAKEFMGSPNKVK